MLLRLRDHVPTDQRSRKVLRWKVFSQLSAFDSLLNVEELEIDMDGIDIFGHDGVIWIAFICLYRSTQRLRTFVSLPNNNDSIQWLMSLGLCDLQVALGFSFSNEYLIPGKQTKYVSRDKSPYSLRRIQIVNQHSWDQVANVASIYVRSILVDYLGISSYGDVALEQIPPYANTVAEFIHNIALHGGSGAGKGMGLVVYTPWPRGMPIIRFCCCDVGLGYKRTLLDKHSIDCRDEKEAIVEALLYRFHNRKDGILGLYPTLGFIRSNDGILGIRTGPVQATIDLSSPDTARVFDGRYSKPDRSWLRSLIQFKDLPRIPGTHIFVDLRLPKVGAR